MKSSLIICTYMRPEALRSLLASLYIQSRKPDEVIIVDGSSNDATEKMIDRAGFRNLCYYRVSAEERGLTRQRNFGISKVSEDCEIVCFLDDDIVLEKDYFEQLLSSYTQYPDALAVGGYITNEVNWLATEAENKHPGWFYYDGYKRKDGTRFVLRKKLGLDTDVPPAHFPEFGHGRSVGFLPPSGKTYRAEQIMGGVSSYRKEVFDKLSFSTYFEGYGLYEDAEFSFRLASLGDLYVNTAARCEHFHELSGRPDPYLYGKMVVRNGWYVWRVRWPRPGVKAKFKWHSITILLTLIRFYNTILSKDRKAAFREAVGRTAGWWSLFLDKPKVKF